jgi:hypothetical protein
LANWKNHSGDELVSFVRRVIRGPRRSNGWELQQKGGRSLEQIVIDCGTPTFTEDDIREARATLGI